jgi:hypothetical protein
MVGVDTNTKHGPRIPLANYRNKDSNEEQHGDGPERRRPPPSRRQLRQTRFSRHCRRRQRALPLAPLSKTGGGKGKIWGERRARMEVERFSGRRADLYPRRSAPTTKHRIAPTS